MDYEHFMRKALDLARKALEAGEFPVGCVIVNNNEIIAEGTRTGTSPQQPINEIDHAEMLALRRLSRVNRNPDHSKTVIFCTLEPCLMCFYAILLSGIQTIVFAYEDVMGGGTHLDLSNLSPFYRNMKFSVIRNIRREESLKLFQTYFSKPENIYWKGSYLEKFTLDQK